MKGAKGWYTALMSASQPPDPPSDNHESGGESENAFGYARPSRSEKKRAVQEVTALGLKLVQTKPVDLASFAMDEELRDAVLLGQQLTKNARSRQLRLIGKLLRSRDVSVLREQLERKVAVQQHDVVAEKRINSVRNELLTGGDVALSAFIAEHPQAREHAGQLRALVRQVQLHGGGGRGVRARRDLFRLLRELEV